MQQTEYQLLCDAIQQKCVTQQWYGPEFLDPTWTYIAEEDDPRKSGFMFSPATEDEIRETEVLLGFPLPAILREIYTKIANGDFGPAYGIRGIVGGAPESSRTLAAWYQERISVLSPGCHRDEFLSSRTGETRIFQNPHLEHSQGYAKALSCLHHFSHTRYLRLDKTLIPGHTFRVCPQREEILR
jgi:hypothetical protein